jgi:hypothetical protein
VYKRQALAKYAIEESHAIASIAAHLEAVQLKHEDQQASDDDQRRVPTTVAHRHSLSRSSG